MGLLKRPRIKLKALQLKRKGLMVDADLFQVMMRNLYSVMSATRPSTCSACDRLSTGFPMESGCAQPASRLWPDVAPA